jgi:hypothetical protein
MKAYLHTLAIMITAAAASTTSIAAERIAACRPVLKAMARTLVADHASVTQSDGRTLNGITAGGINYLQIDGAWKASPLSPKDNQERSDENLRNAKLYVCQPLPDSTIDGVAVANYHTRTEAEDEVVESNIAISKASGLAIQVENNLAGEKKSHYITHYSYTNIHAPSVKQ